MKKIFTLILSMAVATGVNAQTISPKLAAQKAAGLFNKVSAAKGMTSSSSVVEPELAYTAVLKGDTCFYAFNNPKGGFAIIGGDKASREVLAVVDNGSFDVNTIPDATKFILSQYANEIVSAKKAGIANKLTEEGNLQDVANICPTVWDQDKYYNNLTPEYSAGNHCYTGCIATAAAQVLVGAWASLLKEGKGDSFLTTGQRSITFTHQVKDANGTLVGTQALTYDKDKAFDWANLEMKYSADGTYSDAAVEAVAYLMKAMGVMAKMEYGGNLSLACTSDICKGLSNGLGLQVKMANKSKMTDDDWMTLILKELIAGRPVLYTGSATTSTQPCGHAFLVDGFQKATNLFHVNWGWSGIADGYYALNAATATAEKGEQSWLFPTTQGSGSTDSDYRGDNDIIYNFVYDPNNIPAYQPDAQASGAELTQGSEASSAKAITEVTTGTTKEFTIDKPVTVNFGGDGVENLGDECKFVWGIELEPVYETGKEPDVITNYLLAADKTGKDVEDFEVGEKVKSFTVTLSDYEWANDSIGGKIPYGKYQVTPVMFYDADGDSNYEISDEDIAYISMGYNWEAPTYNFVAAPTAIKSVNAKSAAVLAGTRKIYRNGHISIVNSDKQYNAVGQQEK